MQDALVGTENISLRPITLDSVGIEVLNQEGDLGIRIDALERTAQLSFSSLRDLFTRTDPAQVNVSDPNYSVIGVAQRLIREINAYVKVSLISHGHTFYIIPDVIIPIYEQQVDDLRNMIANMDDLQLDNSEIMDG